MRSNSRARLDKSAVTLTARLIRIIRRMSSLRWTWSFESTNTFSAMILRIRWRWGLMQTKVAYVKVDEDWFTRSGDKPSRTHGWRLLMMIRRTGRASQLRNASELQFDPATSRKLNLNFDFRSNAHLPCEYSQNFPLGVESKCKQHYVYRNLLAINAEGKPVMEHFQFPSCCKCMVTSSRSYNRFGGNENSDNERRDRLVFEWSNAISIVNDIHVP
jgi:hypothetical protein